MGWVEEHVARLWGSLAPSPDLDGLLAAVSAQVKVWDAPSATGCCLHWPDGTADVWVPRGERYVEVLGHELGHALLTTGLARHLLAHNPQLARRQGWREEAIANRFACALVKCFQDER